jgi:hypothetical protein
VNDLEAAENAIYRLEQRLDKLQARVDELENAAGLYASDKDLDSPRGDPQVKFMPREYVGPDLKGRRFSQCTPEALDVLAERLTYTSTHPREGKEKFAKYDADDARRARSWARRLRNGWKPPRSEAPEFPGDPLPESPGFEAPTFEAPEFDKL